MENCWSEVGAAEFVEKYGGGIGKDLSLRLYAASLIGVKDRLVLHGSKDPL
jgi:rhamnose utilization protein RhaD (predicted bifunctional aldolase and dehydrogenase)